MAILIRFAPTGLTSEQYNNVSRKLEEAGHWPPQGLLAHVGFGSSGDLRVSAHREHGSSPALPPAHQPGTRRLASASA